MHSDNALVAQRKEISSGARGERLLKHYFYARTARRHEDEGVSEDKLASYRYKAGSAALGLSCGACFEALASVYASAGACTGRHDDPSHNELFITLFDIDRVIEVEMHSEQRSRQSTPGQLLKKAAQATPEGLLRLFVLVPNAPADTVRDESTFFARTVQISHK